MDLNSVYVPSKNVVARLVQGEFIVIPITDGIGDSGDGIFTLNETGRAIWDKLDGKSNLKEIVDCLASEFNIPTSEIKDDILGLVKELLKMKILVKV